jgi:hypothetical protein
MRIDMTTREWHELVRPVLPHVLKDSDFPELAQVRIEPGDYAIYAVATDRYTLGAERRLLEPGEQMMFKVPPVHVRAADITAALKLFPYSKDDDPPLTVTIDEVPVPVRAAGLERHVITKAITLASADGTRVVMHDRRDPGRDPLAGWKQIIRKTMTRAPGIPLDGVDLAADQLARWAHAVRKGERLCVHTGPKPGDPMLVLVEDHFAGVWVTQHYLDGAVKRISDQPWLDELVPDDVDPATGEKRGSEDE